MVGILKSEAVAPVPVKMIRRPERPDKKQLDEALKAETSVADAAGQRIQEIKVILEQNRNWRVAGSPEWAVARARADQVNVLFHDEVEKKRMLKSELEQLNEQMRTEARALKKPWTLDKVEALMSNLRDRLEHGTEPMSAKEQMSLVQQIEELTKWKKFLKECITKISGIKGAIADKDEVLDKLSIERVKHREELEAIKKKEAANAPNVAALRAEKDSAYEKIQLCRERMKKLKEEFHVKMEQFFEADREYKKRQTALADKRHSEFMEREKRRQERQEQRNQMAKEEEGDEYYDKISACEKVLAELHKYTTIGDASRTEGVDNSQEEEKRARQAKLESVQGFGSLLKSKKDRDDDDWFGKPKMVKKPSSNGNKSAKSGSTKLVLQHHLILSFSEVNLPPPRTVGDVADCLVKVQAKKDEFVKLQAEAKARSKVAQAEKVVDGQNGEADAAADEAASHDASESSTAEAEAAVNEAASGYASESSTGAEEHDSLAAAGESVDAVVEETETQETFPEVAEGNETEDNTGGVPEVAEETKTDEGAAVETKVEETKTGGVAEETKTDDGAAVETKIEGTKTGGVAEETKTDEGAAVATTEAAQ